ncbi:MAG: GNAT family N-acetyltransferase [Synergistaceae bacterium]|jgi:ribosomal protein S18 acetylase RimI-like enzyme|nr:GNAT family N-acetyltransferase [Synergistaceae bacterium]
MALDIRLSLGISDDIGGYEEVFRDSALYSRYFADDDRLVRTLLYALERRELWVAANGASGGIIGVMQVQMTGFFGAFPYLALLGVKKEWRGKGAGRFMIAAFEEAARQGGYRKTSIMASSFNPRAANLYRSLGYKKIGYLEDAFKKGIGEYIFVKTLQ